MFTVLPFGNATVVGTMTGAQILEVLNYGPNVAGVIQPAGLKYRYFKYTDANPGPQPYAWGAFDVCVVNKTTKACEPLDLKKTYQVGTNEFLAPAGGDGYNGFKYMKNITYWGDMLNAVNAYVAANYGTPDDGLQGPERRRHASTDASSATAPTPAAASSRSRSSTTTTRTGTSPRGPTSATPSWRPSSSRSGSTTRPHAPAERRRQHPGRRDVVLLQVGPHGLRR